MDFGKENRVYWCLKDPGSKTGVYVNGARAPPSELIEIDDNDLICLGGNFNLRDAKGPNSKRVFLYRVHAPQNWHETDNSTLLDANAQTPEHSAGEESEDLLNDAVLDIKQEATDHKTSKIKAKKRPRTQNANSDQKKEVKKIKIEKKIKTEPEDNKKGGKTRIKTEVKEEKKEVLENKKRIKIILRRLQGCNFVQRISSL